MKADRLDDRGREGRTLVDDEGSIFRTDALEHRTQRAERGDVLRAAPPWTTWAFYALVGVFIVGIILASTIRLDRAVLGIAALDDSGRVVVLRPVGSLGDIAPGQVVQLGGISAEVVSFDGTVVVTSATGDRGVGMTARIIVGSDPAITALVPGLRTLLGGEDA